MILSGKKIGTEIQNGKISISPFDSSKINPNSYNLTLSKDLLCYEKISLDMKINNPVLPLTIPEEGLLLKPGTLYLGRTVERTSTNHYVPMLEGRSSIGRLGIFVHITAGFGDIGFDGHWTLEISCIQPARIYSGVDICQIFFHQIDGDFDLYKSGKYNFNTGVQASKLFEDFNT